MQCVILFRNTLNGRVGYVNDDDDEIAVFDNASQAMDAAHEIPICRAYPYQIVELCDLPSPRKAMERIDGERG